MPIERGDEAVTYPYGLLEAQRVVNDQIGGTTVTFLWPEVIASALDDSLIADGRDMGVAVSFSCPVYDRVLEFQLYDGQVVDTASGSVWNHLGKAVWKECLQELSLYW